MLLLASEQAVALAKDLFTGLASPNHDAAVKIIASLSEEERKLLLEEAIKMFATLKPENIPTPFDSQVRNEIVNSSGMSRPNQVQVSAPVSSQVRNENVKSRGMSKFISADTIWFALSLLIIFIMAFLNEIRRW